MYGKVKNYNIKTILKKSKIRVNNLINYNTCYLAATLRIVWCWGMNIYVDQWSREGNWDIDTQKYVQLNFDSGVKTIQWRKVSLFHNCWWNNWLSIG